MNEITFKRSTFGFIISLMGSSSVIIFCIGFLINQWDKLFQTPIVIFIILFFMLLFAFILFSTIKNGLSVFSLTHDGIAFNLQNGTVYLVAWDKIEEISSDRQHSFLGREYTNCKKTFLSHKNTENDEKKSINIFFSDDNNIVYKEQLSYGDAKELKGTNRRWIQCLSTIDPDTLAKHVRTYWHSVKQTKDEQQID